MLDLAFDNATGEMLLAQFASEVTTVLTSADATERSRTLAAKFGGPLHLEPFDLDDLVPTVMGAHQQRRSRAGV